MKTDEGSLFNKTQMVSSRAPGRAYASPMSNAIHHATRFRYKRRHPIHLTKIYTYVSALYEHTYLYRRFQAESSYTSDGLCPPSQERTRHLVSLGIPHR